MKKLIIMMLAVFLFTGCTVVRIDTDNIDTIINVVLSKENTLYNTVGKGYKYYRPRGVTYIDTTEYNEKLSTLNKTFSIIHGNTNLPYLSIAPYLTPSLICANPSLLTFEISSYI